ncbi:discoidin domain-containing protein [Hyalangium versicolor]|uniref:discoidin domain-containing protein n=1 Tax=Hyalangium versicolor TaxID=2861190 RepID=UPI001CCEC42A|nr:discoidin domain-containing protein [Hyalangium versicolor]
MLKHFVAMGLSAFVGFTLSACARMEEEPPPLGQNSPELQASSSALCETKDLARDATVTSSGYWSTATPSMAVDGNTGTQWLTNMSTGAWLQVDLQRPRTIARVVLTWGWDPNFGTSADSVIEGSTDGATWTPLVTTTRNKAGCNGNTGGQLCYTPESLSFAPTSARYVRFRGTRWNGGWAHLNDFEVYAACALDECRDVAICRSRLALKSHMETCATCLGSSCCDEATACAADPLCHACFTNNTPPSPEQSCLDSALFQQMLSCRDSQCAEACDFASNVVPPGWTGTASCHQPPPVEQLCTASGQCTPLTWPPTPRHAVTGRTCGQCLGQQCGSLLPPGVSGWEDERIDMEGFFTCMATACSPECGGDGVGDIVFVGGGSGDGGTGGPSDGGSNGPGDGGPGAPGDGGSGGGGTGDGGSGGGPECGGPAGCWTDGCNTACRTTCGFSPLQMGNMTIVAGTACSDDGRMKLPDGNANFSYNLPPCTAQGVVAKVLGDPNLKKGDMTYFFAVNECRWFLVTGHYLMEVLSHHTEGPFKDNEGWVNLPQALRIVGRLEPGCDPLNNQCLNPNGPRPYFAGDMLSFPADTWTFDLGARSPDLVVLPAGGQPHLVGMPYGIPLGTLGLGVRQSYGNFVGELATDHFTDTLRLWKLYQLYNCGAQKLSRVYSGSGGTPAAEGLVRAYGGEAFLYGTPMHQEESKTYSGVSWSNAQGFQVNIYNNSRLNCDSGPIDYLNHDPVAGSIHCTAKFQGMRQLLRVDVFGGYCKRSVDAPLQSLAGALSATSFACAGTALSNTALGRQVAANHNYSNFIVGQGHNQAHHMQSPACFYETFLAGPGGTEMFRRTGGGTYNPTYNDYDSGTCIDWQTNSWRYAPGMSYQDTGFDRSVADLNDNSYLTCDNVSLRPDIHALLIEYTTPVDGAAYEIMKFPYTASPIFQGPRTFCYAMEWAWNTDFGCGSRQPPADTWRAANGGDFAIPAQARRPVRRWVLVPESYRGSLPLLHKLPESTFAHYGEDGSWWWAYESVGSNWNGYKPAPMDPSNVDATLEGARPFGKHASIVGVQFRDGSVRVARRTTHSHAVTQALNQTEARCMTAGFDEAPTPPPPPVPEGAAYRENWACGVPNYR